MPLSNEYMAKKDELNQYQKKLTAGDNITIDPYSNEISAIGEIKDVKSPNGNSYVNNHIATIPAMTGATTASNGISGLVPKPTQSDIDKFLKGDGTWDEATRVTIAPTIQSGAKIADYTINATTGALYAPDSTNVNITPFIDKDSEDADYKIADFEIDNTPEEIYSSKTTSVYNVISEGTEQSFIKLGNTYTFGDRGGSIDIDVSNYSEIQNFNIDNIIISISQLSFTNGSGSYLNKPVRKQFDEDTQTLTISWDTMTGSSAIKVDILYCLTTPQIIKSNISLKNDENEGEAKTISYNLKSILKGNVEKNIKGYFFFNLKIISTDPYGGSTNLFEIIKDYDNYNINLNYDIGTATATHELIGDLVFLPDLNLHYQKIDAFQGEDIGYVPKSNSNTQKYFLGGDGSWHRISITPSYDEGTKIADYEIQGVSSSSIYLPKIDEVYYSTTIVPTKLIKSNFEIKDTSNSILIFDNTNDERVQDVNKFILKVNKVHLEKAGGQERYPLNATITKNGNSFYLNYGPSGGSTRVYIDILYDLTEEGLPQIPIEYIGDVPKYILSFSKDAIPVSGWYYKDINIKNFLPEIYSELDNTNFIYKLNNIITVKTDGVNGDGLAEITYTYNKDTGILRVSLNNPSGMGTKHSLSGYVLLNIETKILQKVDIFKGISYNQESASWEDGILGYVPTPKAETDKNTLLLSNGSWGYPSPYSKIMFGNFDNSLENPALNQAVGLNSTSIGKNYFIYDSETGELTARYNFNGYIKIWHIPLFDSEITYLRSGTINLKTTSEGYYKQLAYWYFDQRSTSLAIYVDSTPITKEVYVHLNAGDILCFTMYGSEPSILNSVFKIYEVEDNYWNNFIVPTLIEQES